ncbi:S41 family peptidase [Halorussus halophilus]|uniref:S41 family peptidase n=1 Tax=Halorussus halophilus TaxID=2650975 RepID=UPI0013019434|nr:S41 family peptidase [Halorussus halophilus]
MSDPTQSQDTDSETFDRDALAEDARTLVERIEAIHPEPYVGYESRVELHARLERLVRDLPDTATAEEFYRRAAPLVAGLEDAHSKLSPPESDSTAETDEDSRLPLSFRVVGDRLYVESVFDDSLEDLLGARLLAVEGTPVEQLADRTAELVGVENRYYALSRTGKLIREPTSLTRLLDRSEPQGEPTVRVRCDGEERSVTPSLVAADAEPMAELERSFSHPSGTGPQYRLYEGGDAAVFVPSDLQGYRESFEVALDRSVEWIEELAPEAYERHVGGDAPEDLSETVQALPSMVEVLTELADETAEDETETLILDLRDNPGGDSQFVFHVAYFLDGWEGVARVLDQTKSLKRRTQPHRERYGVDDERGTTDDNRADYDFGGFLDCVGGDADDLSETKRLLTLSETFADVVEDGRYESSLDPDRVVVAVSADTMSSGFAGAAQLTSLGAEVVGVPSGQAPLSYGEAVEETLPNTELTASIAGSMYHWVDDPDPNVLQLDRELTPELFDRYDEAADAGLRLAFDYAGVTDGRPPEPTDSDS